MRLTAKTYYALVASVDLTRHYGGAPVRAASIADKHGIPTRFLELILSELVNAGIVSSKRGSDGGFYLKSDPNEATVYDVVVTIEGGITIFDCGKISETGQCMFTDYMGGLRAAIENYLKNTTLKELSDSAKFELNTLNYVI
ncbi:MAG: hypothetical protein C0602_09480 [Denitrovibrio sp.]|nr:MAG: hypothetical protein C0602_09480 [Denitrovibrio sp.]